MKHLAAIVTIHKRESVLDIKMKLPEAFVKRMQDLLGGEFEEFIASYDQPRYSGLRVNTLKISAAEFLKISPFSLEPVPWAQEGFYIGEDERPAKHPYYHAGLYYIQEPSAMIVAAVLDPQPGDRVLDLCAAPGGKSTQIAARLAGQGLLVANDVSHQRIKGLVRNLEMFGVRNYLVLNELPMRLARRFAGYFDKIVIDAPCSGEGMFRKDLYAAKSWREFSVEKCVFLQKEILRYASVLLKPGGSMVYSTCTFAPEENEGMIDSFLTGHPEFELADIPPFPSITAGRPEWAGARAQLSKTIRLWPHKIKGEGHFVALLKKTGGGDKAVQEHKPIPPVRGEALKDSFPPSREALKDYYDFVEDTLNISLKGDLIQKHSKLYLAPSGLPDLSGLQVIRPGWFLGELKKDRFKPAAPLALGLKMKDVKRILDFPSHSEEAIRYLKGETLDITGERGWNMVCVDGFPLGWAKQLKDRLNNYYPSGWRWMD